MDISKIPKEALHIINTMETAGHEAWLVGGCVRDILLGRVPEDWDITTNALPEDVQRCFARTVPTGIAHGTVTVILDGEPYEVTTYRSESTYSDFRRPDEVIFVADIEADLARRDFTINALAWHPLRGLIDPFGGQRDLTEGLVRAVGNPDERFQEDALRMLRAVRFAAQLDCDVDPATLKAIASLAPNILYVSGERIRMELDKWLMSGAPRRWGLLRESGLMRWVLPELDRCFDIPQNTPWHLHNVGVHTLEAAAAAGSNQVVRWSLLLHDLGKAETWFTDETGRDHFYGHEVHSEMLAGVVLDRLRWGNGFRRRVLNLVKHHDRDIVPAAKSVRRAIIAIGKDDFPYWLAVRRADLLAQNPIMASPALAVLSQVESFYEHIMDQDHCLSIRQLALSGKDLMDMGIPQGPEIGRILTALLAWVVEEPGRNDREHLLNQAKILQGTQSS